MLVGAPLLAPLKAGLAFGSCMSRSFWLYGLALYAEASFDALCWAQPWYIIIARLICSSWAFGCLSSLRLARWKDVRVSWLQFGHLWSAHCFTATAIPVFVGIQVNNAAKFPQGASAWAVAAGLFMAIACVGEYAAHFKDRWVFGEASARGPLHLMFNFGLTSSFVCMGGVFSSHKWCQLAAVVIPVLVLFFSDSKAVKYSLQMAGTFVYAWSYWSWSGCWWVVFFVACGGFLIDVAIHLRNTGNQWLHLFPSFWSWLSYVLPVGLVVFDVEPWRGVSGLMMFAVCFTLLGLNRSAITFITHHMPSYNLFNPGARSASVGGKACVEGIGLWCTVAGQLLTLVGGSGSVTVTTSSVASVAAVLMLAMSHRSFSEEERGVIDMTRA